MVLYCTVLYCTAPENGHPNVPVLRVQVEPAGHGRQGVDLILLCHQTLQTLLLIERAIWTSVTICDLNNTEILNIVELLTNHQKFSECLALVESLYYYFHN